MMRFHTTIWFMLGIIGIPLFLQARQDAKLSFEVASIKQNASNQGGGSIGPRGDRFIATNLSLRNLLNYAFRPPNANFYNDQLVGGPDWTKTDHFDIQAKAEVDIPSMPPERLRLMVQSLLEEQFQLKIHRETRDLPVYDLVVAKSGLKMRPSPDQSLPPFGQGFISFDPAGPDSPPLPRGAMRLAADSSVTTLSANAVNISKIVNLLQGQADRIVLDKTGLDGLFDIQLQFTREIGTDASSETSAAPLLLTAIQDLGLKLEPSKAPFSVVVIDSVQKLKLNQDF